jgi:hypothetical protein
VTATAPCSRRWLRAALALSLSALAATLAACGGARGARSGTPAASAGVAPAFAWLRAAAAPASWRSVTNAAGTATLFYPPGWHTLPGDPGSVSAALRDSSGDYLGYLNVTPRQGTEPVHGWAGFRTAHNAEEGDRDVRQDAAGEGLRFTGARGSCVIDEYLSGVGSHRYREIACLVAGAHASSVFIGAASRSTWQQFAPLLERAASAFVER